MAKVADGIENEFNAWLKVNKPGLAGAAANLIQNEDPLFTTWTKSWNSEHPDDPIKTDGSRMSFEDKIVFEAQRVRDQNQQTIGKFEDEAIPGLTAAGDAANAVGNQIIGQKAAGVQKAYGDDLAVLDQFNQARDAANRTDSAALGQLSNNTRLASDADQTSLAKFNQAGTDANAADKNTQASYFRDLAAIDRVNPGGYGADVSSVAAGAAADPDAVAAQKSVIDRMLGASSAPGLTSQAAGATADPASIEAQQYALDKFKQLSDPSITAEERFMMEQARQQEEQSQRASLGAAMRDLEARGIRSGGAEIGALLGSGQITSQNRMLQDMAAQAQAQQRATAMLQGYSSAADQMRGQSFEEALARGQSADAMGNQNRNYTLNALGAAGDLSSTARDSSFNEQLQAGTAADTIAKFNKEQSLIQQRAADELNVKQNEDAAKNALDKANLGTSINDAAYGRGKASFDASTGVTDTQYTRNKNMTDQMLANSDTAYKRAGDVAGQAYGVTSTNYNRFNEGLNDWATEVNAQYNRAGDTYKAKRDATAMGVGQYTTDTNAVTGGMEGQAAKKAADQAKKDIEGEKGWTEKLLDFLP
jgi:hypothetical protein